LRARERCFTLQPMPTHITAVLDRGMIEQLLFELTPLKVMLGDGTDQGRHFSIDRPSLIEFIPGRGVRFRTSAHAQWTLAGLAIPLTVESATLVLTPSLADGKLLFNIKLEELDVKNVPAMIEKKLVPLINEALDAFEGPLDWNYKKTLSVRLAIPPKALPLEAFTLTPGVASLEVTQDSLKITLALEIHLQQTKPQIVVPPPTAATNKPATDSN
jgi:hypothetical protein